jgi:hypothetical protein
VHFGALEEPQLNSGTHATTARHPARPQCPKFNADAPVRALRRRFMGLLRRAARDLLTCPVLHLDVENARCRGRTRGSTWARGSAVRVVDARVLRGVAIVLRACAAGRGRTISARAAVGVDGAIASGVAHVRDVARRRATTKAGRLRRAIGIGEALVVRAPPNPDEWLLRETAAVRPGVAVGVRRAGTAVNVEVLSIPSRIDTAGVERAALRGARRTRGLMGDGNLPVEGLVDGYPENGSRVR